jgi:hypothetical protein
VAEPVIVSIPSEDATERFIEIRDLTSGNRVITVIEILSPTNKMRGKGRRQYRQKLGECHRARVSFVEIDLLRAGPRIRNVPPRFVLPNPTTAYRAYARRSWKRTQAELYPISLRQRLPIIRIPLRESDQDATLDLQALVDQAYRNGRYADDIDYRADPVPPLGPADAAWTDELLRAAGKR